MAAKKKLLVLVGAGASIELGMPSVREIESLFESWALQSFPLLSDRTKSFYGHIKEKVQGYYDRNPRKGLRKKTNYEELLYVILSLASHESDNNYLLPMKALTTINPLPDVSYASRYKMGIRMALSQLPRELIDKLVDHFRSRCLAIEKGRPAGFSDFQQSLKRLVSDFEVGFLSLNYDNLIKQALPDLSTGFDEVTGEFIKERVHNRSDWDFIYYLHGSVHFDMAGNFQDMHAIKWNKDLSSRFSQNSSGRSSQTTIEGVDYPNSVFVAGYGKPHQIQKEPFFTYYSALDRLMHDADGLLLIGYGFQDLYINNVLTGFRLGRKSRPIIIIDFAPSNTDPLPFRADDWSYRLCECLLVDAKNMSFGPHKAPASIKNLKASGDFEVSTDPDVPLAIWYGGFLEACRNYAKIKAWFV